jgi:hypothetical protein
MTAHFEGNSFGRWCSSAAVTVVLSIIPLLLISSFPQMPSFAHAYATFGSSASTPSSYQLLPAPNYNPTPAASDVVVQEQRDMEMVRQLILTQIRFVLNNENRLKKLSTNVIGAGAVTGCWNAIGFVTPSEDWSVYTRIIFV